MRAWSTVLTDCLIWTGHRRFCLLFAGQRFCTEYLANIPMVLIPEVLEFPQWVDDQPLHKYLNVFSNAMVEYAHALLILSLCQV